MTPEHDESLEGRSDVIPAPSIDVVSLGGQLVRLARENQQLRSQLGTRRLRPPIVNFNSGPIGPVPEKGDFDKWVNAALEEASPLDELAEGEES